MRTYDQMKDSGYPWMGEIPSHWRDINPKALFSQRKDRAVEGERQLTASQQYGVIYQDEYMKLTGNRVVVVQKDFDILKHVEAGDFVISMRSFQGGLEYSSVSGSISSAYVMLIPNKELVYPPFYRWLLKSSGYIKALQSTTDLVRDGQAMRYSNFAKVRLLVAPIDEQIKIADYLDYQICQIDSIIEEIKGSINEYKQLKLSIVSEAVTIGIRDEAHMKKTDVIGAEEVPQHWTKMRFKNIASEIYKGSGITKEEIVEEGNIPCVRYGEIYSKYDYFFDRCITRTDLDKITAKKYFSTGDILFAGTGELVGEIGKNIAYIGTETCLAGGDIIVAKHNENPIFLSYALNSFYVQEQKSKGKAKLKVVHISASEIGNLTVFLPPIEEQDEIAVFLNEKCSKIDGIIKEKEELLHDLEIYKRSLIYDAVTGKRKVV